MPFGLALITFLTWQITRESWARPVQAASVLLLLGLSGKTLPGMPQICQKLLRCSSYEQVHSALIFLQGERRIEAFRT